MSSFSVLSMFIYDVHCVPGSYTWVYNNAELLGWNPYLMLLNQKCHGATQWKTCFQDLLQEGSDSCF